MVDHYNLAKEFDLPFPPFVGLYLCFDTLYRSFSPSEHQKHKELMSQDHATVTGICVVDSVRYYVNWQEFRLRSYFLYEHEGVTEEAFLRSLELFILAYGFKWESDFRCERAYKLSHQ
jgi:hypothetical protein